LNVPLDTSDILDVFRDEKAELSQKYASNFPCTKNSLPATKDSGQEPFSFKVGMGKVIKGWDESVIDMSQGEISKIHCTPDYAYGAGGFPAWGIMPNSELIFEIEVLSFK
jgi:FKBP-type peptidyl-prolyl cis-trans isomerase 2